jgi:hypothetical protein
MPGVERYDGELQMFVNEPRDANRAHLLFLRWLVEQEKIERPISDQPVDTGTGQATGAGIERIGRPVPNWACVPRWFGR